MRSRAAWYWASRSASDRCCDSALGLDDAGVAGADGRFRMRMDGCNAWTGSAAADEDVVDAGAMTTSGIGALLFLERERGGKGREMRVRSSSSVQQADTHPRGGRVAGRGKGETTHASSHTF